MGSKRYLLWNDAIYGLTGHWTSFNYCISSNCSLVANSVIWTVINLSFIKGINNDSIIESFTGDKLKLPLMVNSNETK